MTSRKYLNCTLPLLITVALSFFAYSGCGGTSTGNGIVAVQFSNYNQLAWWEKLIPSAYATVNSATFCFKRIRFKTQSTDSADPGTDPGNIDFNVGAVALSPSGTNLGSVNVPIGIYTRVELDLEDNCGLGYSVTVANSNGTYSTNSRVTVKFEGTFNLDQNSETLNLAVQNIIGALNTVTSSGAIRNNLEAVSGGL